MSDTVTDAVPRSAEPLLLKMLALAFTVFIVGYILVPILVTIVMSFNDAAMIRFPINVWSAKWYADFFGSEQWTDALKNSILIALGTAAISTTAGVLCAWAFQRFHIPFRDGWYILIMMPLFMPGVVLGLGVAIAFGGLTIGDYAIYGSRELVMVAHSLWAMPLVFMLMEATFKTIDYRIVEASYDLGGGPVRTFFEVVLPMVSTGIVSSLLFAFVISLNEFVMALFLTDRDTQTLPVLMWLSLRSAGTPRLAVASVILALTVFACLTIIMLWYVRQLRKVAR
ncbi:MAG: ABC transporter permease [Aestuariivirga sp.]|uniref:ABC transporter permease n=1 Tax=Aestuariivirga sp. TaxID=2650926 RepID=UPI003016AAE4